MCTRSTVAVSPYTSTRSPTLKVKDGDEASEGVAEAASSEHSAALVAVEEEAGIGGDRFVSSRRLSSTAEYSSTTASRNEAAAEAGVGDEVRFAPMKDRLFEKK
jgi:hypothetical protein